MKMKKKSSRVKYVLCIIVCLFFAGVSHAYADFEFDLGIGLAWDNFGEYQISAFIPINWGFTSAKIETEIRYDSFEGYHKVENVKRLKPFGFDILLDINPGYPFVQGGGIFNLYPIASEYYGLAIGIGVGGGYAIGYGILDDEAFSHGPYIRCALPFVLGSRYLGVVFDYFLFEKHAMQIGGYLKYFF
jgi:hypothetical protein